MLDSFLNTFHPKLKTLLCLIENTVEVPMEANISRLH